MADDLPPWFNDALTQPVQTGGVTVQGCPIAYRCWGSLGRPGLLLIHGFNAHSHWWDFIAPAFAADYRVVALDCSGAGDSGHREHYDLDTFADEVIAVAEAADIGAPMLVVGHSFGGGIALRTAARFPERVKAMISVDAKLVPLPGEGRTRSTSGFLPHAIYPDAASASAAFRVIPPQRCPNQFLIDHIARHSVREVGDGWALKADPALLDNFRFEDQTDALLNLATGFGMISGTLSAIISQEVLDYLQYVAPRGSPFTAIPGAAHHVFLDQPLAFIDALRGMLGHWG
ncbi:MAG: alpha/beta hydrolase [Gammaproteobacteria bacterium]|nr:alpha/beta hydrolase [Gammaproteobacteria bacterium]MBK9426302.1 alpha/beta hydrolase [Gammaproteobacteria bacterium]